MTILKKYYQKWCSLSEQLKAAVVYTIASFLTKGLHIITTPIFTRLMSVEQIGVVSNYQTWYSLFYDVATIGLCSGAINIAMKEYRSERTQYIKSTLVLLLLSTMAFGMVVYCVYPWLEGIVGLSVNYILLMIPATFFSAVEVFWMGWKRYEYKYKSVAAFSVCSSFLSSLIAAIAIMIAKDWGYEDLPVVRVFTSAFVSIGFAIPILIYLLFQKGKLFTTGTWMFSLKVGLPLVVNLLAKTVLSASDRAMINTMIGKQAVGLYSVLYTVSSLATIVWTAINSSFIPYLFESIDKPSEKERIQSVSQSVLILFAAASVGLMLFAPEIILVISTREYLQAISVAPPIAAGIFFTAFYSLYGNIVMYYKKTNYIMYATLAAAIFNLVTNLIFIPMFGYAAAAYTTLFSYLLMAVIYTFVARRTHHGQIFDDKMMWLIGVAVIAVSVGVNALYSSNIIRYALIACILVGLVAYRKTIIGILTLKKRGGKK